MNTEEILEHLHMSSETEAERQSHQLRPDYVVDVRAEAEAPLPETDSLYGTKSFSLLNGGPTDPEEIRRAAAFIAAELREDRTVLLH